MRLLGPQLQAFLAVVKNKTVHGAANELHLTQTAITQRIRVLEKHLATSLFVRSRRGMLLTKEGEALLRYCYEAQELEGEVLSCITSCGVEKTISLCMVGPTTIMHSRIVPHCVAVMKQFPNLLIRFEINDTERKVQALRRGESQFAIIEHSSLSEEMEYKELKPEEYVLVASPKWKKRKLKDIVKTERIIDFDLQDQMTLSYLKHHKLLSLANKDRHFVNRTDSLAHMIANELGYGVLPLEFAKPYLANNQLMVLNNGKTYPNMLVLAWFPRHQHPKYFSAIIEACE